MYRLLISLERYHRVFLHHVNTLCDCLHDCTNYCARLKGISKVNEGQYRQVLQKVRCALLQGQNVLTPMFGFRVRLLTRKALGSRHGCNFTEVILYPCLNPKTLQAPKINCKCRSKHIVRQQHTLSTLLVLIEKGQRGEREKNWSMGREDGKCMCCPGQSC